MPCTPISVSLEVDPSELRKIVIGLDKICNDDDTAEWKLHFELQERTEAGREFRNVVKLDVDINKEDHAAAEATAKHGLDQNQRSQAAVAADTAKDGSSDEARDQAQMIIPARDSSSPAATDPKA